MTLRQYYVVRERSWIGTVESPHPSSPNLMLDVRLVRSILFPSHYCFAWAAGHC